MLRLTGLLALLVLVFFAQAREEVISKRDTAAVLRQQYGGFKDECFPRPSGGCNCNVKDASGFESVKKYDADVDCKVPIEVETAANKQEVNEEIKHKFGGFKENCFPKPSGGCKCNEKDMHGNEIVASYDAEVDCKLRTPADVQDLAQTMLNKQKVNEEIKEKFGNFKENCFPKPSGGCKCNEKDSNGNEVVATYSKDSECKVPARTKRATTQRPSQNVRDPVRERAQDNYRAVVNELNEKFKGLKEGCFPRPKGCLCVIGKDRDGRDITERRMKDVDCKCQPGERGKGCPAGGA